MLVVMVIQCYQNLGPPPILGLQVHTPAQRDRRVILWRRIRRHSRKSDLLQAG